MKKEEERKKGIELEKLKMSNAKQYYERGLIIKYGILRLLKNVQFEKDKKKEADEQRNRWVLRNGFMMFTDGMQNWLLEEEERIYRLSKIALRFNQVNSYK